MNAKESSGRPAPREVEDARIVLRETREQLGLVGGVMIVAGLLGNASGLVAALPLSIAAAAGLSLVYVFPVTDRGRWAKRVLNEWRTPAAQAGAAVVRGSDSRLRSAEAMVQRIEEYSGADAPSSAAARAMVQLIYDSFDDLEAVSLLAAVGEENPSHRAGHEQKAVTLKRRIESRMDQALFVIAEIYEAVLTHDDVALREVVARADAEVGRIRAEDEISSLLGERRLPGSS